MLCVMLIMIFFSFASTSSKVQDRRSEFWDISSADVANTTCICSFSRCEDYAVLLQIFGCFQSSRHVSALRILQCIRSQQVLLHPQAAARSELRKEEQGLLLQPLRRVLRGNSEFGTIFLVLGQTGTIYFFGSLLMAATSIPSGS